MYNYIVMMSVIQQICCALYCDLSLHPCDVPVNGYMEVNA